MGFPLGIPYIPFSNFLTLSRFVVHMNVFLLTNSTYFQTEKSIPFLLLWIWNPISRSDFNDFQFLSCLSGPSSTQRYDMGDTWCIYEWYSHLLPQFLIISDNCHGRSYLHFQKNQNFVPIHTSTVEKFDWEVCSPLQVYCSLKQVDSQCPVCLLGKCKRLLTYVLLAWGSHATISSSFIFSFSCSILEVELLFLSSLL